METYHIGAWEFTAQEFINVLKEETLQDGDTDTRYIGYTTKITPFGLRFHINADGTHTCHKRTAHKEVRIDDETFVRLVAKNGGIGICEATYNDIKEA